MQADDDAAFADALGKFVSTMRGGKGGTATPGTSLAAIVELSGGMLKHLAPGAMPAGLPADFLDTLGKDADFIATCDAAMVEAFAIIEAYETRKGKAASKQSFQAAAAELRAKKREGAGRTLNELFSAASGSATGAGADDALDPMGLVNALKWIEVMDEKAPAIILGTTMTIFLLWLFTVARERMVRGWSPRAFTRLWSEQPMYLVLFALGFAYYGFKVGQQFGIASESRGLSGILLDPLKSASIATFGGDPNWAFRNPNTNRMLDVIWEHEKTGAGVLPYGLEEMYMYYGTHSRYSPRFWEFVSLTKEVGMDVPAMCLEVISGVQIRDLSGREQREMARLQEFLEKVRTNRETYQAFRSASAFVTWLWAFAAFTLAKKKIKETEQFNKQVKELVVQINDAGKTPAGILWPNQDQRHIRDAAKELQVVARRANPDKHRILTWLRELLNIRKQSWQLGNAGNVNNAGLADDLRDNLRGIYDHVDAYNNQNPQTPVRINAACGRDATSVVDAVFARMGK